MKLRGKRAFVTGAGGFIGSHLCEALVAEGADVTAMMHYNATSSTGNLRFVPDELARGMNVVFGNIEDGDFMRHALGGADIVFHLAALIAIPFSYVAPRSYLRTNVEGTLNVLEAARHLGIERVVHTSTSEVYGTARTVPIGEDHPLQGQSPYSASKIGADKLAESYHASFELPVVTVRPFNTYGPRQSARAFIPTIISQALDRGSVKLGALDPLRDMTFVSDTVAGFIAAATASGVDGETINLGTGETHSIGSFAQRIMALMKIDKPIEHDESRVRPTKSEVGRLVSDNSLARERLGWAPTVDLDDGLRRTIDFIAANRADYDPDRYTT